jgi:hypothetical protein
MKTMAIAFLFASGMLMAADQVATPEAQSQSVQQPQSDHVSYFDRIALRSQSPSVKTHSRKHADRPTKYVVTENKTTIVAIPRASE